MRRSPSRELRKNRRLPQPVPYRFPDALKCGGSYSGFYLERASLLAFAQAPLAGTAFIGGPPSVPQAQGPSVLAMLRHEHDFVFRQAQTYTTLPLVFMFCMSPAFCLALDEAQLCRGGVAAIEKTKAAATTANLAKSFMTRPPGVVITKEDSAGRVPKAISTHPGLAMTTPALRATLSAWSNERLRG